MFAEIVIHCDRQIDPGRMTSGLPASSDIATALSKTRLGNSPELAGVAFYSLVKPGSVLVAFAVHNTLHVHVENSLGPTSLPKLKAAVEDALEVFRDAADNCSYRVDRVSVSLHAEDNLILRGQGIDMRVRLYEKLTETVVGTCLIGFGTGVAGWLFEGKIAQSLVAASAASLLFIAWIVIGVWLGRKGIEYVDA